VCVDPTSPPLLSMTSNIRIVSRIESMVNERADCANEHHPGSTKEHLIAWRTEMLEALRVFDVRGPPLIIPTFSKPPQGNLERGSANQHVYRSVGAEISAPASDVVCYFLQPPRRRLLTT